jgi:hypothetical protein
MFAAMFVVAFAFSSIAFSHDAMKTEGMRSHDKWK